ncbi:hypothetical protein JNM05_12525 [bacterium]|nr:hypothetical protein [bacterium]
MLADKIRELANDLRRIHLDLKSMELDMRVEAPEEREVDIDKVIDDLNVFKLNITYLRLKANELSQSQDLDFTEVRKDIRYFVTYLKHSADTFDEICNSLTYGGRSGDEVAMQKTGEEIWILERHLHDMNMHLSEINAKLESK